jgi:molecular chaperone DnaK (HSP70)
MVEELKANLPDGTTEVTVNFNLDINAILEVTVTERQSGKRTSERLKASRQRLSPEEIARSRTKLDLTVGEVLTESVVDLDPGVTALLARAQGALQDADLDDELAEELRQLVENIRLAATQEDDEETEALCDQLIDLLFEIEE